MLATSLAAVLLAAAAGAVPAAVQTAPNPELTTYPPANFAAAPPATPYVAATPKNKDDFGVQYWYGGTSGSDFFCLDVAMSTFGYGSPVWLWRCGAGSNHPRNQAQAWVKDGDHFKIKGDGGSWWCLDAGSNPADGSNLKLWECLDVPQQKWQADGKTIRLKGKNLCIDVEMGLAKSGTKMQVWTCYDNNKNQQWAQAWLGPPYY